MCKETIGSLPTRFPDFRELFFFCFWFAPFQSPAVFQDDVPEICDPVLTTCGAFVMKMIHVCSFVMCQTGVAENCACTYIYIYKYMYLNIYSYIYIFKNTYNYKQKDMDIDMIYVNLQYMKCTVFSSGHREIVVTIMFKS